MDKKICYVVTIPGTFNAFFIPQLNYLEDKGFDVTVICSDSDKISSQLTRKIKRVSVPIPRGLNPWRMCKSLIQLFCIFKREQFSLIQYSTPNAALCAAIASWLAGTKIRNYHLMGFRYLGSNGIGRFILKQLEKLTCTLSSSIECVSKSNIELGVEKGIFPAAKATVVWNGSTGGVDMTRFNIKKRETYRREIRDKYSINEKSFVFGFAGRITRDKGINEILEAFQACENAKLMIVGAEENVCSLNQNLYTSAKNNSNIIWTGRVHDVEKYFAAFDFLLLPSYREGFGNVIIEAAAMGTPSIVTNIPGPIDAINPGITGLVIPVKDMVALKQAMHYAQANSNTFPPIQIAKYTNIRFNHIELNHKIYERKLSLLNV